jgi:hypothetical protein
VSVSEPTPELDALMTAARALPRELVRQVADFAEFLGAKYAAPTSSSADPDDDDAVVDLGGGGGLGGGYGGYGLDDWADLSGVYHDFGGHSAIGLV